MSPRCPQTFRVANKFALCKRGPMESPTEFAAAAGISVPYASQLLSGNRAPSQALAISIFRKTGQKLGPLARMSDADIDELERLQGLAA